MKKSFFALVLSLIFAVSCSDGKNNQDVDSDTTENNDQSTGIDKDSTLSDTDLNDEAETDTENDENSEVDEENDEMSDTVDDETGDSDDVNDEDYDIANGCLEINVGETYDFGAIVHGSSALKHVTLCNRCSATLFPDPVKKGSMNKKCDSFFIENVVVAGNAVDTSSTFDLLLSMKLESNKCAEFDAVFNTADAENYPEPVNCEVYGAFTNGEEYSTLFTGYSVPSATTDSADCPAEKGLCYIDGKCYTEGTNKEDNLCKICNPSSNASNWTNASADTICDDNNKCTDNDKCDNSGVCSGIAGNCSPSIIDIDLGDYSACAVEETGKGYCWGINNGGQNGSGSSDFKFTNPQEIININEGISEISLSELHACAISKDGKVYCWGVNLQGQLGREGNGSTSPVQVTGLTNAVDITANGSFSCAVFSDGTVKCWGDNERGTLGNGETSDSSTPVDVQISNVTQISAGSAHVCAIINDGTVKCWGDNQYNQLGDISLEMSNIPVTVDGITNAVSISGGEYHSCAVLASGEIKCWGESLYELLGNPFDPYSSTPVEALIFREAKTVSAGSSHTCAIMSDGGAACWGYNDAGQLGTGWTSGGSFEKYPLDVRNIIPNVLAISTGDSFTCAVLTDNTVKCWGKNDYGQLGQGNTDLSTYPVGVIW